MSTCSQELKRKGKDWKGVLKEITGEGVNKTTKKGLVCCRDEDFHLISKFPLFFGQDIWKQNV